MTPPRYEKASWDDVPENIKSLVETLVKDPVSFGMYIHGSVGSGKTHIVYGIKNHLDGLNVPCKIVNTTDLIFDVRRDFDRTHLDKRHWDEALSEYKGILILDDIGTERVTEYVGEVFYLIMNRRYNDMLPTIFTSNLSIGQLAEKVGDRTASRIIEMCSVVKVDGDDRRIVEAKKRKKL